MEQEVKPLTRQTAKRFRQDSNLIKIHNSIRARHGVSCNQYELFTLVSDVYMLLACQTFSDGRKLFPGLFFLFITKAGKGPSRVLFINVS